MQNLFLVKINLKIVSYRLFSRKKYSNAFRPSWATWATYFQNTFEDFFKKLSKCSISNFFMYSYESFSLDSLRNHVRHSFEKFLQSRNCCTEIISTAMLWIIHQGIPSGIYSGIPAEFLQGLFEEFLHEPLEYF